MADFTYDPATQVLVGDTGLRTWKGLALAVSDTDSFISPFGRIISCRGQWAGDSIEDAQIEWSVSGGVATLNAASVSEIDFFFEICGF